MKTAPLCAKSFVSLLLGAVFMVVPFVAFADPTPAAFTINTAGLITLSTLNCAQAVGIISPELGFTESSSTAAVFRFFSGVYPATSTTVSGGQNGFAPTRTASQMFSDFAGTGGVCPYMNAATFGGVSADGSYWLWVHFQNYDQYVPFSKSGGNFVAGSLIDWNALYVPVVFSSSTAAIATSSGLWNNLTLASSTAQCNSGNLFTDGMCAAGTFLLIPNVDILNGFFSIPTQAATKFPFSWIYGVKTEFDSLSVSSTTAMTTLSYNLHDLGIGSTTSMGNILPNTEVFSKNTIETYISPTLWASFQTLMAAALWLSFFWFEFNRARRMARPH